jgi:hypothetical protein
MPCRGAPPTTTHTHITPPVADGAWVEGGGGMPRNASVFFAQSVAQGDSDYADKFGHYK